MINYTTDNRIVRQVREVENSTFGTKSNASNVTMQNSVCINCDGLNYLQFTEYLSCISCDSQLL